MSELTEKIRSRGHWIVAIHPAEFIEDRVPYERLDEIIPSIAVRLRGWPVPYANPGRHEELRGDDWVGQDLDGRCQFGSIKQLVVKVLELADGDMRVRDIHKRVEYLLGGQPGGLTFLSQELPAQGSDERRPAVRVPRQERLSAPAPSRRARPAVD